MSQVNALVSDSKWIYFKDVTPSEKKTKVFNVLTKDGDGLLGVVKWFGPWRCYSFYPEANTLYERTCLIDITKFLSSLMLERKLVKQKIDM